MALFTDLYELTMMQAYYAEGLTETAAFDLSVRTLPAERNFLIACGIEEVLDYLEGLRFTPEAIAYLETLGLFERAFLDRLAGFRFTGTVMAVPEGTPVFAGEPLLEVIAPLPEAQLVETYILNRVTAGTVLASKAVRSVIAAEGRTVVDFGQRRTHGVDAGLTAARASYIAGFAGTSSVLAGQRYGIPVVGTMAHSYIQAHDTEAEAFRAFVRAYPETTLLVDTYDTVEGVREVCRIAGELGDAFRVRAIRLDSGDLAALAHEARCILDEAGLQRVRIVASGGLDEEGIARLRASGAPIDTFAVGTHVGVSIDRPVLDTVYKLAEYAGDGRIKLSPEKVTLPGRKQVYRRYEGGTAAGDTVGLASERLDGTPLLVEVMRDGRRVPRGDAGLEGARRRAAEALATLPARLRSIERTAEPYAVDVSERLQAELASEIDAMARMRDGGGQARPRS
ncbi:MAG: nicotinate phosphoribosyltransferase [Dehalococcoidia bacterium]